MEQKLEKKIHPAIEYFRQLQKAPPSRQLQDFLSSFAEPKTIDAETFEKGVTKFIMLANSNLLDKGLRNDRKALYGSIYSGLHYYTDLVTLWNTAHKEDNPIKAANVIKLSPSGWDYTFQNGFLTLTYKGQQPAEALDELVTGPTAIDCGMFTQLSLWFGLRYVLGNKRFNQCFGRAPFFITQSIYNKIEDSNKPYSGNPLYSFLSKKELVKTFSVIIKHLKNTSLYLLKHPGGIENGENCIVIDNQYYIFAPYLEDTQAIPESKVLNLLRQSFNEGRTSHDNERLALYAETPEHVHPTFLKTYGELIEEAEELRDIKITGDEFLLEEQDTTLELAFDLHKFTTWLQRLENPIQSPDLIAFLPQPINHSLLSAELLNAIPFENKTSMDFSQFKQETLQQQELIIISKKFCQSIVEHQSQLVILTGKAGVGKTATAVCAAKELAARGKKVVWISEVMVNGWASRAKTMAELDNCGLEVDNLLADDPDVVFLDDDNLAGFSGNLLLEKIYSWYVNNPGKGLFITSNEPICFTNCFGYKLDGGYHYPPFNDYHSLQYLNWQYKSDLTGESLRTKRDGQSVGAIVSDSVWRTKESTLGEIELIPAFDNDEIVSICQSLLKTGSVQCNTYDKLRPVQRRWLSVHQDGDYMARGRYVEPHLAANPAKFEKTSCKTIALELRECHFYHQKVIDYDSMKQLIGVLNYAHDQGGRRIILINQTSYNAEHLLIQIKAQLPGPERERTWSRLMLLLCETEESIFQYKQFNGHIENTIPERQVVAKISPILDSFSFVEKNSNLFFSDPLANKLLQASLFSIVRTPESNSKPGVNKKNGVVQSIISNFLQAMKKFDEEAEEDSDTPKLITLDK